MIKIRFLINCSYPLLDTLLRTIKHKPTTFDNSRTASVLQTVASWERGGGAEEVP